MSKNKSAVEVTLVEALPEVELSNKAFKNFALSICPVKDANGNTRYALVEIGYDIETGDVGFAEEVLRDIREDTIDKFKLRVSERGFFGS